ncbi:deoxyribonuclease-1-like isoform X2 [Oratosquilla oratoria]
MSVLKLSILFLVAGGTLTWADDTSQEKIGEQLRIAAWNLQRFGSNKIRNEEVVDIIIKVIKRYDIILIQEVVDVSNTAVYTLLSKLNNGTSEYTLTISDRLGRSKYQEQYCFYWKPSRVSLNKTVQYNDSIGDLFQFEPFTVVFNTNLPDLPQFAIMALHAKPDDAPNEIDALADVYDEFRVEHGIEDAFLMGDFNAGCNYVTSGDWDTIRLHTDPNYIWLISGHADTTTKTTSCPYDRIVMRGEALSRNAYMNSATTFYFAEELGITDEELMEDVSDHYPVEVSLRGYVSSSIKANMSVRLGVEVTTTVNWADVQAMLQILPSSQFYQGVQNTSDVVVVQWLLDSLQETFTSLTIFSETFPNVLTVQAFSVLEYKLENEVLTDTSLYGASLENSGMFKVSILCLSVSLSTLPSSECTTSVTSQTTII